MNRNKSVFKIIPCLLFLLNFLNAHAQILIKSNDKLVRYDLIKPAHFYAKATVYDSVNKVTSEWVNEHLTKIDSDKKQILFVRYVTWGIGKFTIDSSINNSNGPVSYSLITHPVSKEEVIKYNLTSIDSHLKRRGVVSDKATAMPEGYFDDTSIWELFNFMDLKKGQKYYLNCYGSDQRTLLKYDVERLFDDNIHYQNGNTSICRVIHVVYANTNVYLWIDQSTRICVKTVFNTRDHVMTIAAL